MFVIACYPAVRAIMALRALVAVDSPPRGMLEEGDPLGVVLEPDLPLAHDARVLLAAEAELPPG
jgi:hypothetical protein